jgi:hypothetical protein
MSNSKDDFDILKVVELARFKKYEITAAGFAVLDKIDKIPNIPKKMKSHKVAVQAMYVLSEGLIKYGYFTPEQRRQLLQEANMSDTPYKRAQNLFKTPSPQFVVDDSEEEELPEEKPSYIQSEGDDDDGYDYDDYDEEEED